MYIVSEFLGEGDLF